MSSHFKAWHKELNCEGYFGFASGYAKAKDDPPGLGETYCGSQCPLSAECWTKHKARAKDILPGPVKELEAMVASGLRGGELMEMWAAKHGENMPDPYTIMLFQNLQDGVNVACGDRPQDQGIHTLPWPMIKQ